MYPLSRVITARLQVSFSFSSPLSLSLACISDNSRTQSVDFAIKRISETKYHATVSVASVTELPARNHVFAAFFFLLFFLFIKPAAQDYDVSLIVSPFFAVVRYTCGGKCGPYRTCLENGTWGKPKYFLLFDEKNMRKILIMINVRSIVFNVI